MGKKNKGPHSSTVINGENIFSAMNQIRENLTIQEELLRRRESAIEEKDKELDNLRSQLLQAKENEISQLRAENETLRGSRQNTVSFQDVTNALNEFSGDDSYDVNVWIDEVETAAHVMGWTNLESVLFSKRLLRGPAKLAVRSRSDLISWEKLKEFLKENFAEQISSSEIHRRLVNRKQHRSESLFEYFLKMRELGAKGAVDDTAIIQYTIDGIDDAHSNKAMLYGAKNLMEFKAKLDCYARFRERVPLQRRQDAKPTSQRTNLIRCFNCGGKGHRSKECGMVKRGPRCFSCQQFGHKTPDCPKKPSSNCVNSDETKLRGNNFKRVRINNLEVDALIDTGSDLTVLREDKYYAIGAPILTGECTSVRGISGALVETLGSFQARLNIDEDNFTPIVHILPKSTLRMEMIVGKDVLNGTEISLHLNGVTVRKISDESIQCFNIVEEKDDDYNVGNPYFKDDIKKLISDYKPEGTKEVGIQMRIILKDDTPISLKPHRLSPLEKQVVDDQIHEWLSKGIIQPSESEFSSPIVLANKKDGSKRLCVDYRRLNKQVIRDRFPLPLIEDQIDSLQNARVFSTLDLENGFFHVPVAEDSRKFTSFVTPNGQYEFLRMPFGLCTSPTIFQKFINRIFQPLVFRKLILVYMDDIVVLARDEKEGLERLKEVLKTAADHGLVIKWKKCQFLCKMIEYLGYEVSLGKVTPSKAKTLAVCRFPEPKNIKKLQSFLGLAGYFRKFVRNYAQIAKPLSDLLRKDSTFSFGPEHRAAFGKIKGILSTQPVLAIYNPDSETELHTDASKFGYGAILFQRNAEDDQFHPVHFFSRKTTSAQERYSSYELEVLAIIAALKKLRVYLLGIPFKIVTDCAAFKSTMEKKDLAPRISGWALLLQDYNYTLEHRSGVKMKHVDALSRSPVIMLLESDIVTKIKSAQLKDPMLKIISQLLQTEDYEDYTQERGVLYRLDDKGNKLLCVPKGMQAELVKSVHEQGHFGRKKMEEVLSREYAIPKLKETIETCRRNCIPCILAERKYGKQDGFLHPIPKGDYPLVTYHIDHLGPLTTTKKYYRYILTIVDGFSKFVWIYPVKSLTTTEVIQKLEVQKSNFGSPRHIISDRGTAFTSTMFKDYCKDESIHHTLVTTGVPRGNGQVERMHRVIISVLTKLSMSNPEEWYKYIHQVQRFLNSSWQRSIKKTPFEVLFGVKMRNKEDSRLAEAVAEGMLEAFEDERDEVREQARKNILDIQNENRRQFNRKRRSAPNYNIGDLVAIKRTQFGNALKIHVKYLGPYKVTNIGSNDRFEVEKVGEHEGQKRTTVSSDNMKPWSTYEDTASSDDEENENDSLATGESMNEGENLPEQEPPPNSHETLSY